uniref:NADH-ubiquinone oxidoreductase chain 5 n=1 Tax=Panopea abrupta TaxID=134997 RepID=A0A343AXN0_9BIVA|nr:NADH dehydrogenase subunit 5 [Panopea abrupta]APU51878.1 NADH dehydrogenase subunit 5 [Panopea abrupta]
MSLKFCVTYKASMSLFLLSMMIMFMGSYFVYNCSELILDLELCCFSNFLVSVLLYFDWASILFSFVVILISSCVMMFSFFYMSEEVYLNRFVWLVMLFVLSMNLLIFMPNLLSLMVGWDGLGIVSFLLVIYYQNKESLGAGMITVLMNRIGDVLFIMSIGLLSVEGSWNFSDLAEVSVPVFLIGFIILGSMTKSAQIPFSAWLPAAMAAPTPVSALVHSSTLVTAGVYVLIRFSSSISQGWCFFLLSVSCMTLLLAGLSASFEYDLKKVIALSTLSQLGVMMLILSVQSSSVCVFHLTTHALFKALMFLCAGAVIHFSGGIQDSRFFSGLWFKLPVVNSWLVVSCLSLMGIPFMAGFYSKDLVLEKCMMSGFSLFGLFMILFPTMLTAFYACRFLWSMMMEEGSSSFSSFYSSWSLNMSMSILGLGAIISGWGMEMLVGKFSEFIFLSGSLKMSTLISVFTGVAMSVGVFVMKKTVMRFYGYSKLSSMFLEHMGSKMWFLPYTSGYMPAKLGLRGCSSSLLTLDLGWVESFGGGKMLSGVSSFGMSANYFMQSRFMGFYLLCGILMVSSFFVFI